MSYCQNCGFAPSKHPDDLEAIEKGEFKESKHLHYSIEGAFCNECFPEECFDCLPLIDRLLYYMEQKQYKDIQRELLFIKKNPKYLVVLESYDPIFQLRELSKRLMDVAIEIKSIPDKAIGKNSTKLEST